jgi:hypothetical protein
MKHVHALLKDPVVPSGAPDTFQATIPTAQVASVALARPGPIWTPQQAACLRPSGLALMGKFTSDEADPLALETVEPPPPPVRGNRRHRRAMSARSKP